jgi:flagellar biosynthesis chaperone FliJ
MLSASQTNASSEMFDNYKNQMNSPEMTEMSDQLADLDGQLKEYQNELNRIKSDVEKRYE